MPVPTGAAGCLLPPPHTPPPPQPGQVPAHPNTCFTKKGAWNPGSAPCPWGRPPPCAQAQGPTALRVAAGSTSPHRRLPASALTFPGTKRSSLCWASTFCLGQLRSDSWGGRCTFGAGLCFYFQRPVESCGDPGCGLHNSKTGGPLKSRSRSRSANQKSVCLNT